MSKSLIKAQLVIDLQYVTNKMHYKSLKKELKESMEESLEELGDVKVSITKFNQEEL